MFCLIFLGDIPIGSSDALKNKNKKHKRELLFAQLTFGRNKKADEVTQDLWGWMT